MTSQRVKINIVWMRRDLRLEDQAALYYALKGEFPVLPLFIFDREILDDLPSRDERVVFIYNTVCRLHAQLGKYGSTLFVRHGKVLEVWADIVQKYDVQSVYCNRDYESYAKRRDREVSEFLKAKGIHFYDFKDHVIFEGREILKADGNPYTVFSPYARKWLEKLNDCGSAVKSYFLKSYPNHRYFDRFYQCQPEPLPTLESMGFEPMDVSFPPPEVPYSIIKNYGERRNFPAIEGTSRLGIHYRFGTVSIREKARKALGLSQVYLNELIWRDFYSQILQHFPHVENKPFRPEYQHIPWRYDQVEFERWKTGQTGYPIVDAGMRELNETGYMHNRVRMITASFLTKHLLMDYRLGEAYFALKLHDFDLASNNGGWQWAAGCGTDAAPYFRIFNPIAQAQKFDSEHKYVKRWVPEFGTSSYPKPMVEHSFARQRCLETFKTALAKSKS